LIANDTQLKTTWEQLQLMYGALSDLCQRILPVKKRNYGIFTESPIEEIRRLRAGIDEYLGLNEAAADAEPASA
jgi:hypothetical protein